MINIIISINIYYRFFNSKMVKPPDKHKKRKHKDNDHCCDDDDDLFDFPGRNRFPFKLPPPPSNFPPPNSDQGKDREKRLRLSLSLDSFKKRDPICEEDLRILGKLCMVLDDFVLIGKTYNKYSDYTPTEMGISEYRYNAIGKIARMNSELTQINEMIGLKKIKTQLCSQIAYLLSNYKQSILMHTAIAGPPGTGKTMIAKLIGQAYHKSGILTSSVFIQANRAQLIGKFLGQTAPATKALFDKAKGGVIFIDEIYSLSNERGDDTYSKECIDTINQMLSEHRETMCIIAGYAKEMDECFFSMNKGLESRFPWRFEIEKYSSSELLGIFTLQINQGGWTLENDHVINASFFEKNKQYFVSAGRDVENFYVKCCIAHATRLFLDSNDRVLSSEDINKAFTLFKDIKNLTMKNDDPPLGMYI